MSILIRLVFSLLLLINIAACRDLRSSRYQKPLKRVEIRVFRGSLDPYYGHTPWGYFVKQPADE